MAEEPNTTSQQGAAEAFQPPQARVRTTMLLCVSIAVVGVACTALGITALLIARPTAAPTKAEGKASAGQNRRLADRRPKPPDLPPIDPDAVVAPKDATNLEFPALPKSAPADGSDEDSPRGDRPREPLPREGPVPDTKADPGLGPRAPRPLPPEDKVLKAPAELATDQEGAMTRAELRVKKWAELSDVQKKWTAGRAAWECRVAVKALKAVVARVRLTERQEMSWGLLITALQRDADELERDGQPPGGAIVPVLERLSSAEKLLRQAGYKLEIAN